jgi:membrane associated rhomboid family serine protease
MSAPYRVRGLPARGAFAGAVLVSVVVLFTPASGVPFAPAGVDKVVHAGLFALLAVTGRWAGARSGPLAVLLVLYAGVSEVVQHVTPLSRTGSVADWLADVVGLLVGLAIWAQLPRRSPPG